MKRIAEGIVVVVMCLIASTAIAANEQTGSLFHGSQSSAEVINLGDYAKGDGTDETEAIQRAFDALMAPRTDGKAQQNPYEHRNKKAVLYIPAPAKFYGISKTIKVFEKWNVLIECETPVFPGMKIPPYFYWLGPDEGTMFEFNFCGSVRVENLSMSGGGKRVLGIQIGKRRGKHPGFFKYSSFNHLTLVDVGIGIMLGDNPSPGADVAQNSYNNVVVNGFSEYAVHCNSGNAATQTFVGLSINAADGAKEGVRITGGQLSLVNSTLGAGPSKIQGAAVAVYAGGVHVLGAWSEWRGPFLYGHKQQPMPGTKRNDSSARYSTVLMGVQHYPGGETQFWRLADGKEKPESENPVPISIDWDRPVPLTLINCSLWGGVKLGAASRSVIIDLGTTFSNRDGLQFYGEGIERYGRLLQLGTVAPDNIRVLEPYIVDRRNTPGTAPPKTGVWQKGDCIRNTDPSLTIGSKAWAGWICIEAGEPGIWKPYGRIGR